MKTSRLELNSRHFLLLCLLLVGLALRLVDLGRIPPFGEEAVHLLGASVRAGEASPFWTTAEHPGNMASFNLTWPLLQIFGSSAAVGRVVTATAGSLLVLLVLLLRKREDTSSRSRWQGCSRCPRSPSPCPEQPAAPSPLHWGSHSRCSLTCMRTGQHLGQEPP